ncbi:hypothetical protein DPMN_085791 [Dreissena polymorpha]|uniref:Uncharacterized protein n=1 Tax=Dreissena polymorpha TaxID=45954 RepID=A0A9D4BKL5_DREPO|nr:hypothetical protein DPMN_085791 [Dreissena polymorpha]
MDLSVISVKIAAAFPNSHQFYYQVSHLNRCIDQLAFVFHHMDNTLSKTIKKVYTELWSYFSSPTVTSGSPENKPQPPIK